MDRKTEKNISKFLSLILRHKPEKIGIELDRQGWANVKELLKKSWFSREELEHVVANNDKKRFAFNDRKTKIRACQGHSIDIDLICTEKEPPDILYHGTSTRFLNQIMEEGLSKMGRQHVHLSNDFKTATKVGKRHGVPVVILISASFMHSEGHKFYLSDNGVWLTEAVPAQYFMDFVYPE